MQNASEQKKNEWNQFVNQYGPRSGRFLHSWKWGEFQKSVNEKVERVVVEENNEWVAVAMMVEKNISLFGSYLYIPKGLIVKNQEQFEEVLDTLLSERKNPTFLRFEPEQLPENLKAKKTIDVQPAHTLITDLTKPETTLLENMHHKTRYNIGLAERKDVQVCMGVDSIDSVWPLFEATAKHGNFSLHSKSYYEAMTKVAFLATAKYEDRIVAANLMIDFDGVRTYLHGASSPEHRKLMAPYILHWDLMVDAKSKGIGTYDWWGIAPENQKHHKWAGITRFKKGFGGEEVSSPGTFDFVSKPFVYKLYKLARKIYRR